MGLLDLFRGKSPREKFARKFIQALREQGEARPLHFDERQFIVRTGEKPEEPENIFALHNVYALCERAKPAEHDQIIQGFVASLRHEELPEDYATARARLYLSLKDRTYPQIQKLRHQLDFPTAKKTQPELAQSPAGGDLIACVVYDGEQSIQFVNDDSLTKWGVSMEQVRADAVANMRANLEWAITETDGVFRSNIGDTYDSSRLFFTEAIRELPLRGSPVAVVPDRETLLLAGSDDREALGRMAGIARKRFEEADRLVSGRAVILGADGWTSFEPPEALSVPFGNLQRLYDARYYAEQKEILEALFEQSGEDIFVATLNVSEHTDSGRYHTWATWTRDVLTLLPESDKVALYDSASETLSTVQWGDLKRVMGSRMAARDYSPLRWQVGGFPSNDDLAAMGAESAPAR